MSKELAGDIEGDAFVDGDARCVVAEVVEPKVDQFGPRAHDLPGVVDGGGNTASLDLAWEDLWIFGPDRLPARP